MINLEILEAQFLNSMKEQFYTTTNANLLGGIHRNDSKTVIDNNLSDITNNTLVPEESLGEPRTT